MNKKLVGQTIDEIRFIQPEGLCEKSAAFWEWAADVLRRSGRAHEGDSILLDIAAWAHHGRQQAIDLLAENESILVGDADKIHPAVKAMGEYQKQLLALAKALGLTPAVRATLGGRSAISQRELKDNPFNSIVAEAEGQNGTHEHIENAR